MINNNEYLALTQDKGVLKRILKSGEGNNPKDNQEVEGIKYILI
jgi:hypothetical protein